MEYGVSVAAPGGSTEQPFVPPHRCIRTWLQSRELRVPCIDDDVPFNANDDGGHDQNSAAPLGVPFMPESSGRRTVRKLPTRNRGAIGDLATHTRRYLDNDEPLVPRRRAVPLNERLQHRRGVALGCVDDLVTDLVPASRHPSSAIGAEHGPPAFRVTDSVGEDGLREAMCAGQTATPASARHTRFSTVSTPGDEESVISSGDSPSSSGCGRTRKSWIRGTSP